MGNHVTNSSLQTMGLQSRHLRTARSLAIGHQGPQDGRIPRRVTWPVMAAVSLVMWYGIAELVVHADELFRHL